MVYFPQKEGMFAVVLLTIKWGVIRLGYVYTFQNYWNFYFTMYSGREKKKKKKNMSFHLSEFQRLWGSGKIRYYAR